MIEWYREHMLDTGAAGVFWMLIAFVVTFLATRIIVRRIRAREVAELEAEARGEQPPPKEGLLSNVSIGGVHVHHQVWGILILLVSSVLQFWYQPGSPWVEILGGAFGVGAALTLDEFALWLHLDDVYWSKEGQKSIDAVVVAFCIGAALLVGTTPLGLDRETGQDGWIATVIVITVQVCFSIVAASKGKLTTAVIGLFVPLVSEVGAIRLAKPDSMFARWRYADKPKKMARATRRHARYDARWDRMREILGGAPHRPSPGEAEPGE